MDIKTIVERLIKKHQTNNPFLIAQNLNIIVLRAPLKNTLGFFSTYKRSKFIHLNSSMPEELENFVCAHELGHAIQHPKLNTPFLKSHTLFSTDRIEREANIFAVELLLLDATLQDSTCSLYQLADSFGIPRQLSELKFLYK